MCRSMYRASLATTLLVAMIALAACGSQGGGDADDGGGDAAEVADAARGTAAENEAGPGERGGTLTMLSDGDVDFIDPGQTYYSYAFAFMDAMHRKLYSYKPDDPDTPVPDLAAAEPEISADGETVTVRIRPGVMFSAPVSREVTSADVKYAIERAFTANVANGYARVYFGDVVGVPEEPGDYEEIEGIQTPDDQTIVFRLSRGTGALVAGALGLPISAPVPQEYAEEFDAESPSTYGLHQVFTGPYAIPHDAEGTLTGYEPNRRIRLVRNEDYVEAGDFRPAFLDEIDVRAGNADVPVAMRRILGGESLVSGDGGLPPAVLRTALQNNREQISLKPAGAFRYVSMDTTEPPFDDINVRKAVIAGFDRTALRLARGGETIGPIAQHFIPPGIPGFEESGGEEGRGELDFMANPEGDPELMAEYFRRAGFESGRYEGDEEILLVADSADPDGPIAERTDQQLREMGFETNLRLVNRNTMFTRFCNVPDSDVNVCPSVGWLKDFADPQTLLDATFNGDAIVDTGNSNWPELDVPEINEAMEEAELVTDPQERAEAWADINQLIVAQAPGIPYVWDNESAAASSNVRGVQSAFTTIWDLSYTSLK